MSKESELRKGKLSEDANEIITAVMDSKKKEIPKDSQTWFRRRQVDAFIVGAARAFYQQRTPLDLPEKSKTIDAIPFYELKDKETLTLVLQIIAYCHYIREAGNNQEMISTSHLVLQNLSECISIAEKYFNGGWLYPIEDSFKKLISEPFPDSEIMRELKELLAIEED